MVKRRKKVTEKGAIVKGYKARARRTENACRVDSLSIKGLAPVGANPFLIDC